MLKRYEVKYLRDISKSAYEIDKECYICGRTDTLQFHHYYSLTQLWEKWKAENGIDKIDSEEDIQIYRLQFKKANKRFLYDEVVTLCKFHHMDRLHKIFGQSPDINTAEKQKRWVEIQRGKVYGASTVDTSGEGEPSTE